MNHLCWSGRSHASSGKLVSYKTLSITTAATRPRISGAALAPTTIMTVRHQVDRHTGGREWCLGIGGGGWTRTAHARRRQRHFYSRCGTGSSSRQGMRQWPGNRPRRWVEYPVLPPSKGKRRCDARRGGQGWSAARQGWLVRRDRSPAFTSNGQTQRNRCRPLRLRTTPGDLFRRPLALVKADL